MVLTRADRHVPPGFGGVLLVHPTLGSQVGVVQDFQEDASQRRPSQKPDAVGPEVLHPPRLTDLMMIGHRSLGQGTDGRLHHQLPLAHHPKRP